MFKPNRVFKKKKRYIKRNHQRTTFKNENKLDNFLKHLNKTKKRNVAKKKKDKHANTNQFETVPNKKGNERTSFFFFDLEKCVSKQDIKR